MEPLLVFPDPAPAEVVAALDGAGYPYRPWPTSTRVAAAEPEDGWAGAVVCADTDPEAAFALCRALRKRDVPLEPLLLVAQRRAAPRPRAARGPLRRLLPRPAARRPS